MRELSHRQKNQGDQGGTEMSFIIGLFIGSVIGFAACAICVAGRDN
jgi:hypothetical protein